MNKNLRTSGSILIAASILYLLFTMSRYAYYAAYMDDSIRVLTESVIFGFFFLMLFMGIRDIILSEQ
ncbi:MAG: hypothetical protein Q6363_007375 [Candidatus Njordarchaeota archaeon]